MRKPIIIMLCVLLALGGVYAYMRMTAPEPVEEDNTATGGEFVLSDIDPMTVMYMRYSKDGEEFRFKYSVKGWLWEEDEACPLDQTVLENMVKALCKVTSDRLLTSDRSTFKNYGLDPAFVKVELEDSKGNVYGFNIGDKHPTTSKFYFNVEGSDDVYTVPTLVGRYFQNYPTLVSLIGLPHFPSPKPSQVYSLTFEGNGIRRQMVYAADGDPSCYTGDYKWFWVEDGSYLPLDADKMTEMLTTYEGMGFFNAADYASDPAVLKQYGLDEESRYTITIDYNSIENGAVSETFYVGVGEDGGTYGQYGDNIVVGCFAYTMAFFEPKYENLKAVDFCKLEQETVDTLEVVLGDQVFRIEARRTEAADTQAATVTYVTAGDKELDGGKVTALFNTMRGIKPEAEAPVEEEPSGTPYLRFDFERNTEAWPEMTLKLWEYDDSYYLSSFAGELCLINKLDVRTLVSALSDVMQ